MVECVEELLDGLCELTVVTDAASVARCVATGESDVVALGTSVGGESGGAAIRIVKDAGTHTPIVVLAGSATDPLPEMLRRGAYDYLCPPFDETRLLHTLRRAMEFDTLCHAGETLKRRLRAGNAVPELVGQTMVMDHLREKIAMVAKSATPVLVTGEQGVGKLSVAREIHRAGRDDGAPFVVVNCAIASDSTVQSTAAGDWLEERVQEARGGTIVFDEIASLDMEMQEWLAGRLADDGASGVRVISTTSMELRERVQRGTFREDLYYRVNMIPLDVPPLRERREDVPLLVGHFIRYFADREGCEPIRLTEAAMDKLRRAYWRGNVRELRNVIERAVILDGGRMLDADEIPLDGDRDAQMSRVENAFRYGSIRDMEKLMILNRLQENEENRTRSARTLEISVRTLRNKLHEYNVPPRHSRPVETPAR
jgi:DNA-binding NtrC family response regulator